MNAAEAKLGRRGADLLADPCAFRAAGQGRQWTLLDHIERLARRTHGAAQPAIAKGLGAWLARELPLHLGIHVHVRASPAGRFTTRPRDLTLDTAPKRP